MKRLLKSLLLATMLLTAWQAQAIFVTSMPIARIQPNGDTLHCFATGDEFYHRLHDAQGYTIVQDPSTGYWVYAQSDNKGSIMPSQHIAGTVNPASLGLQPNMIISKKEWENRVKAWDVPTEFKKVPTKTSGRNHGDYANLVIFVRFADDDEYSYSFQRINKMFCDSSSNDATSVYNYFKQVSYNKLFMRTYWAPQPVGDQIISYRDSHPRGYYMPWSESNTIGYSESQRSAREFDLLVGAINFINDSFPVPEDYILDYDNDGEIDNVNFIIKGTYTGWSDLLWPHKWNLYGRQAYINGKRINTFNFELEGSGSDYFGASTFCHEMSHSLSAPDLYHYGSYTNLTPVGQWDLMATNTKPPQQMGAYMKWKYGNWIDSIPTITQPGHYTLHSIADSANQNNAYKIPSCDPNQFYVVEYRDNREIFETTLAGKGLIIYRIDTRAEGNSNFDGHGNPDEVYVFRPDAFTNLESGQLSKAYFCLDKGRSSFSPSSNPYPFLSDNSRDLTISITNIGLGDNTISFDYTNQTIPVELRNNLSTTATTSLSWLGAGNAYRVYYRHKDSNEEWKTRFTRTCHITLTGLDNNSEYEWKVRAFYTPLGNNQYADSTHLSTKAYFHTELCNNPNSDSIASGNNASQFLPFVANAKYTYSQQIYCPQEIDGAKTISTMKLHYQYATALTTKTNCTIYMAHTSKTMFESIDDLIPASQLEMVYEGPLSFEQGWNEIVLTNPFFYNGDSSLVVAIDDNSGVATMAGNKFYCSDNPVRMAITLSSNYSNPEPEDSCTFNGDKQLRSIRNHIQFIGCPEFNGRYYACVISDNDEMGRVQGGGSCLPGDSLRIYAFPNSGFHFDHWSDEVTDNPRMLVMDQDTLIVGYFLSNVGIEDVNEMPGFFVTTRHHELSIKGAEGHNITVFDITGRRIAYFDKNHDASVTAQVRQKGIYIVKVDTAPAVKVFVD